MAVKSISELKKICRKEVEVVWYARFVIRPFTIYITWVLLHTPLTANQTSIIGLFLGLAGSVAIGTGTFDGAIAGAILLQISYILDCIDGEIARARGSSSVNGIYIDLLGHRLVIPAMFLGLTFMLYFNTGSLALLLLGIVAAEFSSSPMNETKWNVMFSLATKRDIPWYDVTDASGDEDTEVKVREFSLPVRALRKMIFFPGNLNVVCLSGVLYYYFQREVTVFLIGYFAVVTLVQIALFVTSFLNHTTEKEFKSFLRTVIKSYGKGQETSNNADRVDESKS